MKVHVVTPVWGRPEVTKIFALGIQRIGADITTITSTPEDYKLYGSQLQNAIFSTGAELTEEESFTLVEAANV